MSKANVVHYEAAFFNVSLETLLLVNDWSLFVLWQENLIYLYPLVVEGSRTLLYNNLIMQEIRRCRLIDNDEMIEVGVYIQKHWNSIILD
jgi:hypothetical protein